LNLTGNDASSIAATVTTVPSGSVSAGISTALPPGPLTRPPPLFTTVAMLPSGFVRVNAGSATTVWLPFGSVMTIRSVSVSCTGRVARKPPFGSTSAGNDVFRVTLTIETVSCSAALPCVPMIVVLPAASGIDAVMLPAGGGGGGVVSRLVKCATTGGGSVRAAGSLISVQVTNVG